MSDTTHPAAAVAVKPTAPAGPHHGPKIAPSFTELVFAHFNWWQGTRNGNGHEVHSAYHELLRHFESAHGRVISSYWCSNLESGVALAEQKRRFPFRSTLTFHRESDWATKQFPEIAAELHRCDELAIRARTVLTGVRQRICLHLVAAAAAHLLSLVDAGSAPKTAAERDAALKREQDAIGKAWAYYEEAANGQAEIVYFAGMASAALAIAVSAGLVLSVEWKVGVGALVAGAIGALVSVMQRINAGDFQVDHDVGRPYAFFLGALRPLIGGFFAIAIAFAFSSGFVHLPIATASGEDKKLALLVVSFLAGFSERWAQDTLATALPQAAAEPK